MLKAIKRALSEAFVLAKPYWTSDEKRKAWALMGVMIVLKLLQVYSMAQLTYAVAGLFDALDLRQFEKVPGELIKWLVYFFLFLATFVLELHLRYVLIVNWRQYLTESFLGKYLSEGAFNQVELKDYALDNPDQRIAVDINNFVTRTLDLSMALLANVGRLFAFSYVLWTVSGELPLPIAVGEITIPGYMIWVALIYAGFATWITHVAGRRLIPLKFDQQQVEADFRYHLARIREHSDSISMASGGPSERRDLMTEFALIRSNWLQLLKYERRVLGLSLGFGQLSQLFPYLAALPALIAGTIALGGVVQLGTAFGTVVGTLSWFARAYSQIADWKASVDRLTSLDRAMNAAEDDLYASEIDLVIGTQDTLSVSDLTLSTPTGRTLLEAQSFQISAGQNTLITGPSGSGKSTLFRAIAGQWVWGSGQVVVSSGKMFFIPQTPYLPKGSLRSVLAYPGNPDDFEKQYMSAVLQKCSLSHLTELLDETRDWGRSLSGGEKQLLCLARALIARPDWLFMDEVTSAMDPTSESNMLKMLFAELLNTTCVLIAHGKTKSSFFQTQIHLNDERKSLKVIGNSHPLIPEQSGRF